MAEVNAPKKNSKVPGRVLAFLLALGFLITGLCMFYLLRSGVSLRTAPIISPSPVKEDLKEMTNSLFVRLLPELRPHDYIVWGALPLNDETRKLIHQLMARYEQIYKSSVQLVPDGTNVDNSFLENCQKPCWILLPSSHAHELTGNDWIQRHPVLPERSYGTISIVYYARPSVKPEVSEECLKEKKLDLECLKQVSLRDAWKKMKDPQERYFFVRQYNQRDLFLFIEERK